MTIQAGFEMEWRTLPPVTIEQLRAYAEASGDFNPIHLDEEVARRAGLPGIIAHGMWVAAQLSESAQSFVRSEPSLQGYQLIQFHSRFKAMTQLGDTLSIGGMVREVREREIWIDLQAKNQRGEVTTLGSLTFRRSAIFGESKRF